MTNFINSIVKSINIEHTYLVKVINKGIHNENLSKKSNKSFHVNLTHRYTIPDLSFKKSRLLQFDIYVCPGCWILAVFDCG